jgi:NDP-sugar pyrophosphorylase family protein
MNILIPAAGLGRRFKDHHDSPKIMIDVKGEPMIVAVARSLGLNSPDNKFIFLIPDYPYPHPRHKELGARLKDEFSNCTVLCVVGKTDGSAHTAIQAVNYIENDEELLIVDCNQIMHWDAKLKQDVFEKLREFDAGVVTVNSENPNHSYIDMMSGNIFVKELMPNNIALTGLYWWRHGKDFIVNARLMMQSGLKSHGEYYVGSVYNWFKGSAGFYEVMPSDVSFLDSPKELKEYLEK